MKMDSMGTKKTAPFLKVAMYGIPCILFPATMNFASVSYLLNQKLMTLLKYTLDSRAGHLKWIVVQILEVIVVMFETTGGLVRGHLVKNSCLTVDTKFWGKWQKCPPQKANFFVCQPNGMKFLQQVSDNILLSFCII